MPHHIKVTDIKVERLQDISDEDCLREGVGVEEYMTGGINDSSITTYDAYLIGGNDDLAFRTPREAFAALIDKISGKGTWERNPWVFAYEFELID